MVMKLIAMKQPLTSDTFWCTEVTQHDCEVWNKLQQCNLCTNHLLKIHSIIQGEKDGVLCIRKMNSEISHQATAKMCIHHNSVRACQFKYQLALNTPTYDSILKPFVWTDKFQLRNNHQQELISLPELKDFTVVEQRPQFCLHHLHKIFENKRLVASFLRCTSKSIFWCFADCAFQYIYLSN